MSTLPRIFVVDDEAPAREMVGRRGAASAMAVARRWSTGASSFSSAAGTWLPMPDSWGPFTAEAQLEDVGSTLSLYRQAIELRYSRKEFTGSTVEWYGAPEGCLAFRRSEGHLICALNTTAEPVELPPGELLLSSYPLTDGLLPPRSAAWLAEYTDTAADAGPEDTATAE